MRGNSRRKLSAAEQKARVLIDKKALACTKIAQLMLPNGNSDAVENQAYELMKVEPTVLNGMYKRLSFSRKAFQIVAARRKAAAKKGASEAGDYSLPPEEEGDFGPEKNNFNDHSSSRIAADEDLGSV